MPDWFWTYITILLLVRPIGTLLVPVAHKAVVDTAALVLTDEMDVLPALF